MSRRSEVLKPFERKKAFMEDRIEHGIELYRKGFAFLHLSDAEGKPVNGARVRVRQKTHDFRYGANLFMLGEFNSSEQNAAYETLFADAFNIATLPFYWSDLEPEAGKPRFAKDSPKRYRRPAPDLCLEYCEARGIEPKAHCLNYAGFQPDWAKGDVSKEKRLLDKRFRELAARYSERIPSWEVTNETFWGMRIPRYAEFYRQDDLIEWSFETAERYFHTNRLIINEVDCKKVEKPMPKLPVATAFWTPKPDLSVGAESWILAGGAHHTAFSYDLTAEQMVDWADAMGIESVVIDGATTIRGLKNELKWNSMYYMLKR